MNVSRIAIVMVAIALAGCSKGEVEMIDTADGDGRYGGADGYGSHELLLESVDPLPLQAEASQVVSIKVRIKDNLNGGTRATENVQFELRQSPDMQTSLSALNAVTNEQGVATIDLRLGMLAGAATVTALHPKAGPLDINVTVSEATTGKIRVDISDPGNKPIEIAPYRVQFFDNTEMTCADYVPRSRVAEPITEVHVADTQPVTQQGFPPTHTYTVVAEGIGNGGLTLAGGCAEGISVAAGDTTVVPVRLDMVPIQPAGTYEVAGEWDISEAVASQNGATGALVGVVEFMANPGESIYNTVIDAVEDAIGFSVDLLLGFTGIRDRAIDYINDQLYRVGSIETFSAIAADLNTMLNELKVTSRLNIAKTDQDFNFQGTEDWTSVEVSWTWKCEQRNSADCETHVVDLTENGGAAGAISYQWTGFVQDYDTLIIESHQAQIDIGRLQLYLLEQVIIPDLTDGQANTLGGAMAHWIDCDRLARRALGGAEVCDPTGFLCVGEDEAAVACEYGIEQLGNQLAEPLRNQSIMLDIALAGEAKLVDADANGIADAITDGRTEGTMAGSTEPVTVQWSGQVQQ